MVGGFCGGIQPRRFDAFMQAAARFLDRSGQARRLGNVTVSNLIEAYDTIRDL